MNKLPLKIKIEKDTLVQELDNTVIILNLNTEQYYGLDNVGSRIWQLLSELETLPQVYNVLIQEYDVDPKILEDDMLRLIKSLSEAKLISVINEV